MFTKFSLFVLGVMQENISASHIHIFKIIGLIICIITLFWSFVLSVSAYNEYYSKKYIFIRFFIVGLWYQFFWGLLIGNHIKEQQSIWRTYLKMISANRLLFLGLCVAMALNLIFFILTNLHEEDDGFVLPDDNTLKVFSANSDESKTNGGPVLDPDEEEKELEMLDSEWEEKETLLDKLYKHFHKDVEDCDAWDNNEDYDSWDHYNDDFMEPDSFYTDEEEVTFDPKLYERYHGYYDPYVDEY